VWQGREDVCNIKTGSYSRGRLEPFSLYRGSDTSSRKKLSNFSAFVRGERWQAMVRCKEETREDDGEGTLLKRAERRWKRWTADGSSCW
jgi:hypothetical protein